VIYIFAILTKNIRSWVVLDVDQLGHFHCAVEVALRTVYLPDLSLYLS